MILLFDSIRKLSKAIGSRSLIAKSIAIGGIRLLSVVFALSARAAIETAPDWAESEPPIRFKSRDWADAVLAAASTNSSIAIEGGRLLANTTWDATKTHLVFNTVYIPSGITLTISEGAVVKFCPGTTIKVEDGGKLSIVGASGNDVILTAANDATVGEVVEGLGEESIAFDGIRLQSTSATFTDNSHLETRGFNYGAFPTVSVLGTEAVRNGGVAYVPFTLSGSSRETAFSIEWEAVQGTAKFGDDYTLASGTISWGKSSEGTKTLRIPLNAANVTGEERTFTVRIKAARGSNIGTRTATVKIVERDALTLEWAGDWAKSEPPIRFKSRDWADAVLAAASTNDAIAIEGGRLLTNTTWDATKTHLIFNTVYVPSGVTLTISEGAIVKFCPGTMIKVEDGGKLSIVGASGNDVILTAANDATAGEAIAGLGEESFAFGGIRLQSTSATFTDNGWLETRGFNYGAYPSVTLNDSTAFRSSGLASIPVTISGTRDQTLTIDWVAVDDTAKYGEDYTLASGRITWGKASEGTKTISIPLVTTNIVGATTSFKIKIVTARGANIADGECTVSIREFDTLNIESGSAESTPPIRFKSRDWADAVLAAASTNDAIAIEGGRLLTNTTWDATKTHLVFNTVYIPSGITLTISEGAVVKFCPGTMIKVEDGGKLNIVGASGNDVILTAANDATAGEAIAGLGAESIAFDGIRLQSTAATFTDNGWLETRGFNYGAYPSVTLHDATANRKAGMVYLPVTVGGTTRNQSFTVDWVAEDESAQFGRDYATHNSGRLTWSKSGDGTKYITIPLVTTETAGSNRTFKVRFVVARGVNVTDGEATVTIAEFAFDGLNGQPVEITTNAVSSTEFEIKEGIESQPIFLNDVEQVRYSGKWQTYDENEAAALRVTVDSDNGTKVLKECSVEETGSFELRQSDYATGFYMLKHEILNNLGETLATMKKSFSIIDTEDVELHGGILTQSETWSADKVHVVYETVTVPAAYTLFIEPGAIVKFMTGTGIDISQGGALFANKIVFTHINDDTIGGDTLSDGYTVAPPMDAYTLSGNFTFGDDTELRNITQNTALAGTISTRKVLSRGSTYRVSGTLTVANGGSLTIPPGTVLKMESGASIVVNRGATLTAVGTRAAPIIITSIKDDSVSGDTNGDGDKTIPQPGDWRQIRVAGGAFSAAYLSMFYLSNDNNQGGLYVTGGEVKLDCCTIAHCNYDCMRTTGGVSTVENSIFADASIGVAPNGGVAEYRNCIFNGLTTAVRWPSGVFVNCVFSDVATIFFDSIGSSPVKNCLLWNTEGYGPQTDAIVGKNGNIWGDPLFVDPDNGDFRIEEGSPCVDAADSSVASEFDYYGQPRITIGQDGGEGLAALPDIGICEVMPRNVTSDIDFVPQNVRTVTNAVPGELLFVKWDVKNAGGKELEGAWRDTVSLVSSNGREIQLGVKTTSGVIAPGGSIFCSGYFTIPPISEGEWYPKVNVNSYRDVFEGALGVNNALVGDRALTVMAEALDPSVAREGVIGSGTPSVIKLTFGADDENRMVKFDVPAGVKVTWGFGFMPQGASQSGSMTATDGGVMFRVPEGATDVYVVLESDKTATYEMTTESTKMVITGVAPNTLPSSGTTTLVITGAGFGETNAVILASDSGGRVVLNAPQKDASGNLIATVDCSTLTAGVTYGVRVESDEKAAALDGAVTVTKAEGKGEFWYELVLPQSSRTGRISAGYVVYGNSGTANLVAPIIDIVSTGDGKISKSQDGEWSHFFRFLAIGENSNPMVLLPGDEGRVDFYVMTHQRNDFSIYTSNGKQLNTDWLTQAVFEETMINAGGRIAWSGEDVSDYEKVYALAKLLHEGVRDNSIGGTVRGSFYEGVENAIVDLYEISDDSTNKVQTVIASITGRFVFNGLEDGRYIVGIAGGLKEDVIAVSNGLFVVDVNMCVNTTRSIAVTPDLPLVSNDITTITLTSCLNPSVVMYPIAIRHGNECIFDSSMGSGFYRAHCIVGNNEGFEGVYISSNSDVSASVHVSQSLCVTGVVSDLSTYRLPDTDVILSFRGSRSGRTYVVIPDANTGAFEIEEMVCDSYAVTYSGLTCSYESDIELIFDEEKTYSITFSPVSVDKVFTISYPIIYNNHMLVVAGPEGVLTVEALDGSGCAEIRRVKNGVWSFIVVEESGAQVATASFELTDEIRSCKIGDATISASKTIILNNVTPHIGLRGLGSWLSDKFKALTHWLGEKLADILPVSIMDFLETKEWKEGENIKKEAMSYFSRHRKIGYPGPCCCGYNDQKYPHDKAALSAFSQQINEFSSYVQSCSSMKVVASTSKSIANVADNIAEQLISSYTGEILNKMAEVSNLGVAVIAVVDYVNAATESGARYEEAKKEIDKLKTEWDAVVFCLKNGGEFNGFMGSVLRLSEYIEQWTEGKRNYFSKENKEFETMLKKLDKALKNFAIVVDAVRDIYNAGEELEQMRNAADEFHFRKNVFLQKYAYFKVVAEKFHQYHEGTECQPEKWPDPEYTPPGEGPYPYPVVVISCDPNEMSGPLGLGDPNTERFVKPGEWMTYTVYFENMTNATAAAQEVYVTNPLSEWLDWSTFEMGEVSFGNQIDIGLSGKSSGTTEKRMDGTNWIVRTELSIEPDTTATDSNRQQKMCAKWYLRIVDPTTSTGWPNDPVAGFLPPNNPDTHCGEGHLTYRIKLRDDAPAGLVITNSATIVFDYNEPITTDPAWWNTVAKTVDVDCDGGLTLDDLVVGLPFGELSNPEPREGYIFEGWYTGKNGTGTRVTADTIVTAGMTSLYAHWTQIIHTVIVDGVATNVAYGTELMFTAPESFIDDTCTTQLVYVGTSFYQPTTNEFSIVVTNNIEFTWDILATNYWLNIDQPLHGAIIGATNGWYLASTVVDLSVVEDTGYSFNKWNGDIFECTELGAVLSVPMNKPRSIGASFVAEGYTITYAGTKDIENTNPTSYTIEDEIVFVPLLDVDGWKFTGWQPASISRGSTGDVTVTAQWERIVHSVTVGGVTTNVTYGTEMTFVAPEPRVDETGTTQLVYIGSSFYQSITNEFTVVVTNNIDFIWDILATNYWLNVDQPLHGAITGATNGWYLASTVVDLSAVEDTGYSFNKWNGDIFGCTELGAVLSVPMNKPRSIGASFDAEDYTITYSNTNDAENLNPLSYTIEDEIIFEPLSDVDGWKFTGWQPASISRGSIGNVTVIAQWSEIKPELGKDDYRVAGDKLDGTVPEKAASVYDGYLYLDNAVIGTIQAKVSKPKLNKKSGVTTAKTSVTIQITGEKKITLKGELDVTVSEFVATDKKSDRVLILKFGSKGITGTFGKYDIDGARNLFDSKDKSEKSTAEEILKPYLGAYSRILDGGILSVTIAKKGKVTIKGSINGNKVALKAQALIG